MKNRNIYICKKYIFQFFISQEEEDECDDDEDEEEETKTSPVTAASHSDESNRPKLKPSQNSGWHKTSKILKFFTLKEFHKMKIK